MIKALVWDDKRQMMFEPRADYRPKGVKKRDFFIGFNGFGLEVSEYEGKGYWRKMPIRLFTWVHDDVEDNKIFNGAIVEFQHEERTIICTVCFECGGFMLVSNEFEDGFIWFSDVVESDGKYNWIPGTKVIGDIYQNPELLGDK
ncbi:YopX family protein [Brevibacillus laterosporus]|uniref:YopX family protein n=1 Tax=Brevibacillus laterosporus TaxID=1465 RepID=UPI003D19E417